MLGGFNVAILYDFFFSIYFQLKYANLLYKIKSCQLHPTISIRKRIRYIEIWIGFEIIEDVLATCVRMHSFSFAMRSFFFYHWCTNIAHRCSTKFIVICSRFVDSSVFYFVFDGCFQCSFLLELLHNCKEAHNTTNWIKETKRRRRMSRKTETKTGRQNVVQQPIAR